MWFLIRKGKLEEQGGLKTYEYIWIELKKDLTGFQNFTKKYNKNSKKKLSDFYIVVNFPSSFKAGPGPMEYQSLLEALHDKNLRFNLVFIDTKYSQ